MKSSILCAIVLLASFAANAKNTDCKYLETFLKANGQKVQLLQNAYLIRPYLDTKDQANEKFAKNVKGDVYVYETDILGVTEGPSCFSAAELKSMKVKVSDLNGKYLVPGLHDMHIHNFGFNSDVSNTPLYDKDGNPMDQLDNPGMGAMNYRMLFSGVTTHLDLMSFNRDTMKFRDLQREYISGKTKRPKGTLPLSNIYMTGGLFAIEDGHHGHLDWFVGKDKHTNVILSKKDIVEQKDKATRLKNLRAVLKTHIEEFNPVALKLTYDHNPFRPGNPHMYAMTPQLLGEFVQVAKSIKPTVKVICHVGIWKDVIECMEQGADAITHLPFSKENDPVYKTPEGIYERMKKANMTVITTMTVYMEGGFIKNDLFNVSRKTEICQANEKGCECSNNVCTKVSETAELSGNKHYFEDALLNAVAPSKLLDHYFTFDGQYNGNKWIQWGVEHNKMGYRQKTFVELMNSGVRVLSGTDTSWEGTFFGFSLHRELELMMLANEKAETPLRPVDEMQILKTSTSNVHEFLGHKRGRMLEGYKADFVALDASPLDSILNTRKIHKIVVNGILVEPQQITPAIMGVN